MSIFPFRDSGPKHTAAYVEQSPSHPPSYSKPYDNKYDVVGLDLPTIITATIALIGGLISSTVWLSSQLGDLKERLSKVNTSIEVYGERLSVSSSRIGIAETQISHLEADSDRRLEVLEEEITLLFNYLVSLYKQNGEQLARLDDMQNFLESAIVTYIVESGEKTVNKTYKRSYARCNEEVNEEVRRLVMAFTGAKAQSGVHSNHGPGSGGLKS